MKIKQLIILSFCLCGLAACEDIYKGGENHLVLVDFQEMDILQSLPLIYPIHRIDVGVTHFT